MVTFLSVMPNSFRHLVIIEEIPIFIGMTITVTHNLFQHLLFIEEILTFVIMTVINNGIVLNYNQLIFLFTAFTKKNAIACCWLHILLLLQSQNTEFSAVGSALRSGRRGRWFKSSNSDKPGQIWVGLFCF